MNLRLLMAGVAVASLALAACGGSENPDPTPNAATSTEDTRTPTIEPGASSGPVASGQGLRSADGRLEVAGTGPTALDVSIREAKGPPAAPKGWQLVTPVYDITAREPGRTALVIRLKEPLELRFKSAEPLATVVYYDGDSWELVRSDVANGVVEAQVDHLTPYAVARPAIAGARAIPTPSATRAANTVTAQPPTPPAGTVTVPAGTRTPGQNVTATVATVSPEAAKAALEAAVSKYKGKTTKVTGTAGYSGSGSLALPPQMSSALTEADLTGDIYYGLYNGVNEAFAVTASGGASTGSFTLLVEPKTEFPTTSSRAQELLAGYFPGAAGMTYVAVQSGPTTYTYQASNGSAFFVLGFVQQDGMPLAFLSTGSGVFTAPAVSTK